MTRPTNFHPDRHSISSESKEEMVFKGRIPLPDRISCYSIQLGGSVEVN